MGRRKNKDVSVYKIMAGTVIFIIIGMSLCNISGSTNKAQSIEHGITPQNIETMVKILMDQDAKATQIAILSATPTSTITPTFTFTPTFTEVPTHTPIPTDTPLPYEAGSWLPSGMENNDSTWQPGAPEPSYYDGSTYYYPDGSSWTPYTSVPDNSYSVQPETAVDSSTCNNPSCGCVIKGNINSDGKKIYHCPNSPNYDVTKINKPGERYFCTEEEALLAGFSRSGNTTYCGF